MFRLSASTEDMSLICSPRHEQDPSSQSIDIKERNRLASFFDFEVFGAFGGAAEVPDGFEGLRHDGLACAGCGVVFCAFAAGSCDGIAETPGISSISSKRANVAAGPGD